MAEGGQGTAGESLEVRYPELATREDILAWLSRGIAKAKWKVGYWTMADENREGIDVLADILTGTVQEVTGEPRTAGREDEVGGTSHEA